MRVRVRHQIDRLAGDYAEIPVKAAVQMRKIVSDNIDYGRDLAKALARAEAGPHGKHYYKRINSEMTGPLEGEFGPDGTPKTEFVGVGFRSGTNKDLEAAAKALPSSTARDVRKMLARLFA